MKKTFQSNFWILLIALLLTNIVLSQETISQTNGEIIAWIRQNSIPLEHLKAENGFSDLQPLKKILKDVKVVGLGENTHGTREFFQIKHRLLEFLVTQMDFNGFAIEAGYAACTPINDYVLQGKGNRDDVLTGQGFVVWDTKEMATIIDWIRAYNEDVPMDKKVRFYGLDYAYNGLGSQKILGYLRRSGADNVLAVDSLFQAMAKIEKEHWPFNMSKVQDRLKGLMPKVQLLIDYLSAHKEKFSTQSSSREFDGMMMYATAIKQWFVNNISDSIPASATPNMLRSRSMANNLFRIMDLDEAMEKVVVWEHNVHVSIGEPETGEPNMGHEFRAKYGDAYFAVGFEFNKGFYQSRILLPDNTLGDLKFNSVAPAPEDYLAWYLSQAGQGNFFLDLREPVSVPSIKKWKDSPQLIRHLGWLSHDVSQRKTIPGLRYDGILFFEETSPTIPTSNALMAVANGEGL